MLSLRAVALLFTCLSATAMAATPIQPKVVFIGDELTAGWNLSSNPNWVNQGSNYGTSVDAEARFQADVVNLHPAIVHIMVGAADAGFSSPASQEFLPIVVADSITSMVAQAKAANIKVILGTEPPLPPTGGIDMTPVNAWIEAYGAANNIPVINYADALCGCVGSVGPSLGVTGYFYAAIAGTVFQGFYSALLAPSDSYPPALFPTGAGYALMTEMAQNTIATVFGAKLKSGYLQNFDISPYGYELDSIPRPTNSNLALVGDVLQFVAVGAYSDGIYRTLTNTNFAGLSGTWTSSNPVVMLITQSGQTWAISPGTARISYRSPNGIYFSPWDMTVTTCTGTGPNQC
jgi:lysophospholipase L1-like esterase